MRPTEKIEDFLRNTKLETNTTTDRAVLENITETFEKSKQKPLAASQPNLGRIIIKSRIAQVAAAAVIVLAVCWLTVSDKGELEQQEITGSEVAATSETPAELMSVISLSIAFRDGDMEALDEQCRQAEKLMNLSVERITIEQLICELEGC